MPINDFSIGKDISFTVVTGAGPLTLTGKTDYSVKPQFSDLKHKGLGGITKHGVIPDGWVISIKLDRSNPEVDNYFAQREADYYAGLNAQGGTILETIQEKDGSISQFRYTGVILKYDDAGDWKGDSLIPISLSAMAERRIKVA